MTAANAKFYLLLPLAAPLLTLARHAAAVLRAVGFGTLALSLRASALDRSSAAMSRLGERALREMAACAKDQASQLDNVGKRSEANRVKRLVIDAYHAVSRYDPDNVRLLAGFLEGEAIRCAVELDDFEAAERLYRHAIRYREAMAEKTMLPSDLAELADVYEMFCSVLEVNGRGDEMEVVTRRAMLLRKRVSRYSKKR